MKEQRFRNIAVRITDNPRLRDPQREGYTRLNEYYAQPDAEREVGIVLPVGCGKSGLIALSPFALESSRTLVVAPNVKIAEQLLLDFKPSNADAFYYKCGVLKAPEFPEPAEIRGKKTNRSDIEDADVVVTNIQQLQGEENKWLSQLPDDFFDLILFDEAHHNIAESWNLLREKFPAARIVNFSATPQRSDGRIMNGPIIYTYTIADAVQKGYVKRLHGIQLNPRTLKFVRGKDGTEIEVDREEILQLASDDPAFRRGILLSDETLATIVDASLQELTRIRRVTGDARHKIIASALNYEHCQQVVSAYRARNQRVDFVHSKEDSKANDKVLEKLKNHELDVIVQVRKLGEGFDHPYLSVAAVFSIFASLAPFAQFVGRIMRVIVQNDPTHIQNQGSVVFHAGANVAPRWEDFRKFSEADQKFFELLTQEVDFAPGQDAAEIDPTGGGRHLESVDVREQAEVLMEEIPLVEDEALRVLNELRRKGLVTDDQIKEAREVIRLRPSKQDERRAVQIEWDNRIKNKAQEILAARGLNFEGKTLDRAFIKSDWQFVKAAIDRQVNERVAALRGQKVARKDFSLTEWAHIEAHFGDCCIAAQAEVFGGEA